ncbi:hypothetical protein NP233_g453 [Leucocoprinus birnbaumii]|uniref:Uncharacterized protein n=1 Tax=Leucocoprinus birnbaumii TaxID=56174 RepID=A0AAD5W416_9AGAR|nr:hypothetical protein NP233_g453 [Leucocoprinus birnbaumii]
MKFISQDPYSLPGTPPTVVDSIYVKPAYINKKGQVVPGRFDTAVIDIDSNNDVRSLEGCGVGRICCIFSLPPAAVRSWFPDGWNHNHLAYLEWYTPFSHSRVDPNSRLYQISPLIKNGDIQFDINDSNFSMFSDTLSAEATASGGNTSNVPLSPSPGVATAMPLVSLESEPTGSHKLHGNVDLTDTSDAGASTLHQSKTSSETPRYKPTVVSQTITLSILPTLPWNISYGPPPVIHISSNRAEILDDLRNPDLWTILHGLGFEVDRPPESHLPPTPPPSPAPFANLLPIAIADEMAAQAVLPPLLIFIHQDVLVTVD